MLHSPFVTDDVVSAWRIVTHEPGTLIHIEEKNHQSQLAKSRTLAVQQGCNQTLTRFSRPVFGFSRASPWQVIPTSWVSQGKRIFWVSKTSSYISLSPHAQQWSPSLQLTRSNSQTASSCHRDNSALRSATPQTHPTESYHDSTAISRSELFAEPNFFDYEQRSSTILGPTIKMSPLSRPTLCRVSLVTYSFKALQLTTFHRTSPCKNTCCSPPRKRHCSEE